MGRSDPLLRATYSTMFPTKGDIALLGFTNNDWSPGDLYDLRANNWDINSDWKLTKKYDSIISTRCPYFSKNPHDFIKKCHENLKNGGEIFLDWGLGDHWRFENYKIGWVKDGEHEYAYDKNNYLWSTVWHDSFLNHPQFKLFQERVKKFGYSDVRQAIYDEVPVVYDLKHIKEYFNIEYNILTLWVDKPQIYFFIKGVKND